MRLVHTSRASSRRRMAAVIGLVAAGLITSAAPTHAASKATYYLALGDSVAAGEQPIGGDSQGYPDQLLKDLRARPEFEQLRLEKLACGGETSQTMLDGIGSACSYSAGSQLDAAVAFLHEHPGDVALITITIGANDIFSCFGAPDCVLAARARIQANLPVIVAELREAAGPDLPIVGMNYWSPLVVDWFANPGSAQAWATRTVGFNDLLEGLYAAGGSPVADVETAFAVTDFTTMVELDGAGPVPLSVYSVCTLTWICTGPPLGPDIHPNTAGHAVIAATFEDAVPL
jgi:lysophospholipase L1-like esterase